MKARNMRYIHFDKFRSSSADPPGNKRVCIANMTHLIGWGGIGGNYQRQTGEEMAVANQVIQLG